MKTVDFDFDLPEKLIAQKPSLNRDEARLLVVDRTLNETKDLIFSDILSYLGPNDVLVFNNTKVDKAKLILQTHNGGKIEVLVIEQDLNSNILALVKPQRKLKIGSIVGKGETNLLEVIKIEEQGYTTFKNISGLDLSLLEEKYGKLPLPPYIKSKEYDEMYQTVYAKTPGSIASPTAGLHFTSELISKLVKQGVQIEYITLNVGLGTFMGVKVDQITDHKMHYETYTIDSQTESRLNKAVSEGKKITCVGTTSVRTLESNYNNGFHAGTYSTNIFIYPGYTFKITDHIITNFHLPKSTLIMLVSSFYSLEKIREIYLQAIEKEYRFYSFGDAMFIL
jgi:S-adenosylmethionine:tRNA ribosyltransferase-isomerase